MRDFLVSNGIRNLKEFVNMFRNEDECKTLCADVIPDLPMPLAQTARLREAWSACEKAKDTSETNFRFTDDDDEDIVLGQEYLNDLGSNWSRHELRLAPHVNPGELLVSRVCKQISKRILKFQNILKVHTEAQEGSVVAKRRERLSEKTVLEHLEAPLPDSPKTVASYMCCIYIYCVALAKAGINPLSSAPAEPESPSTEDTLYVELRHQGGQP